MLFKRLIVFLITAFLSTMTTSIISAEKQKVAKKAVATHVGEEGGNGNNAEDDYDPSYDYRLPYEAYGRYNDLYQQWIWTCCRQ